MQFLKCSILYTFIVRGRDKQRVREKGRDKERDRCLDIVIVVCFFFKEKNK